MKSSDILLIIVAIIFPPAVAAFIAGCSLDLVINILLSMFGYVPGLIHAFWLIYNKMQAEERYGIGGFQYVGQGQYEALYTGVPDNEPRPNYGATNA